MDGKTTVDFIDSVTGQIIEQSAPMDVGLFIAAGLETVQHFDRSRNQNTVEFMLTRNGVIQPRPHACPHWNVVLCVRCVEHLTKTEQVCLGPSTRVCPIHVLKQSRRMKNALPEVDHTTVESVQMMKKWVSQIQTIPGEQELANRQMMPNSSDDFEGQSEEESHDTKVFATF